jgi:eukaryotic-like serine/threonine-protein kinase
MAASSPAVMIGSPTPAAGEPARGEPLAPEGVAGGGIPSVLPPEAKPDPYIGATIDGRYKIECVLGEGGMGVVYKGRHKVIDKPVAIKVLRADMARDVEITERFLREARAASAIGNPHIIDISDFGTLPDGSTYFVMEFLDGRPLSSISKVGDPVPVVRVIHIAEQIADGLAAAHEREIVHRDLKPDNIFVIDRGSEKDFVKILDFGIAKVSSGTAKLTRHGSVFGTPHYMSPEQAAGAPVDHRTDIYSLGVILYEMSCGRVPFDADNFMGILTQHMYQAPVPIRALVPPQDIPPGLEAIVLKCLSKKPDQRFQSMSELRGDFEKLRKGLVPDAVGEMMARSGGFNVPADFFKAAMPVPVPATPAQMMRRKPWPLYAGIAGVVAAVAIVVGIFAFGSYSKASVQQATSSAPPVAVSSAATTVAAPSGAPPAAAPTSRDVLVASEPVSAEVTANDKKLGPAPVNVPVPAGSSVRVTVTYPGFFDESFTVDGSEARKDVKLRQKGGKAAPGGKPGKEPASRPPNVPGNSEIVDPWARGR